MTAPGVLEILSWAAPPVIGALAGFFAARLSVRIASRRLDLTSAVSRMTSGILASPISAFSFFEGRVAAQALQRPALELLKSLTSSPAFLGAVREAISREVSLLSARTVKDAIESSGLSRCLAEKVLPRLAGEESRTAIARSIASIIGAHAGPSAGDSPGKALSDLIGPLVPAVVDRLVEGIKAEETRAVMAARGRELLPKILLKLNVLQRLLISAGQFDKRIDEKMPEIVDDTVEAIEQALRDPVQQAIIREKLIQGVGDWRGSKESVTRIQPVVAGLVERLLEGLADPKAGAGVVRWLEGFLGGEGQALGSALRTRFGVRDEEAADSLTNQALSWFSRPRTQDTLSRLMAEAASRLLQENAGSELGVLLGIDPTRKEKLDENLASRAAALVGQGTTADNTGLGIFRGWAGIFGAGLGFGLGLLEIFLRVLLP